MENESRRFAISLERSRTVLSAAPLTAQLLLAPITPLINPVQEAAAPSMPSPEHTLVIDKRPSEELYTNIATVPDNKAQTDIPVLQTQDAEGFLQSETAKIILSLGTIYAIAAGAQGYMLGKKYDDNSQSRLRNGASALLAGGTSLYTAEAFSLVDINSHIPSSMILGFTLLQAGYNIRNTMQRERNPRIRAASLATSGLFIALGATVFLASDKLK